MASFDRMRRNLLIAAVCVGVTAAGAAPASAAIFTASVGDSVSGTAAAPKSAALTFSVDVRGALLLAETPGIKNLSLQLPTGVGVTPGAPNACTQDVLRAEPAPPMCVAAQIGSGVATGYGIGITFDAAPVVAYRDADGTNLNLRLTFARGGISIVAVVHVAVAPVAAGGTSLAMVVSPIQIADNEFVDVHTLNITLGNASSVSAIATTACAGNWPFTGTAIVRGEVSTPLSAAQPCTQGAEPPPPATPTAALVLPLLAPAFTLHRATRRARARRVLGTLTAIGGLRPLADGVALIARCAAACSPRRLAAITLQPTTPKAAQLRLRKSLAVTSATRIEIDAARPGWTGRYAVFRFGVRGSKLVARLVESGCLSASGVRVSCPASPA